MPDQRIVLPGVDDDTNNLVAHLFDQLEKQYRVRNLIRASYYDSKRAIRQVGSVVPPQYYKLGIVLGWTGKAIDLLARRCNLDGFVWPDGDLASIGGDDLWDDNHLRTEVNSAIVSSLLHGPAFLVNTVGGEGEPSSLIHVKDALSATGDWNPRRRSLDNLLSVTGRDQEGVTSFALYLENLTIAAEKVDGHWEIDPQEHQYGVPAEMMPYKPRVGRPFGSSRITRPAMGYQDAATRTMIRLEGHMDIFAYPEYWLLGADLSVFKNADGTQMSAWQARMGRIKGIPDDEEATNPRAAVQQFTASDPSPHLADLNALAKMFARDMSLPDTAVAITDVSNPTSAESYDASQYELIAEAEGATDDWTPALRRAYIRGLAIANGIAITDVPDSWKSIDSKWRDPRYLAKSAQADAGMKQITAAPWLANTEVGLELLGLTEQQIKRAMADQRRTQGTQALQQILADAANKVTTDANSQSAPQ